jgi:hypothetical protein
MDKSKIAMPSRAQQNCATGPSLSGRLSAVWRIWQSGRATLIAGSCAGAILWLPGMAMAGEGGPVFTMRLGAYVCEMPGTALTETGIHQSEQDFTILQGSTYATPKGRGTYLASGDEVVMTTGPLAGRHFRRLSENFLRLIDGQKGISPELNGMRCVRKVLNNQ